MATRGKYCSKIVLCAVLLIIALPVDLGKIARADNSECGSVKDCAEQMVRLANRLMADNEALAKRVGELEQALRQQASDTTKAIEDRASKLKTGGEIIPAPVGNVRSATCPPGSYMVAILHQLDGGGPHGITSWLQPVCRSMN